MNLFRGKPPDPPLYKIGIGETGVGERIMRVLFDSLLKVADRLEEPVLSSLVPKIASLEVELVGFGVLRATPYDFASFRAAQTQSQSFRDLLCDFFLEPQNFVSLAFVLIAPELGTV